MLIPKTNIKSLHRINDIGGNRKKFICLDKNERTVPFSKEIYNEMMASININDLSTYPDQTELYCALSNFYDLSEDHFLITPGSDAGIKYIFDTFVQNNCKILSLSPTYAMVDVYTKMFEAIPIKIGFDENLNVDIQSLINSISNVDLIYIANPNQPTGTIISIEQIIKILIKAKENNVLVLVDEAYIQFSNQASCIKLIKSFSNLIIAHTFSKGFGLASVRLGYLMSQSFFIDSIRKVKPILDINLFAIKFGTYLLNNYNIVEEYINHVKQSKIFIEKHLNKNGIDCISGHANFIHLKFPKKYDTAIIARRMKERGYLVRSSGNGLPAVLEGCIRITVGPLKQMKLFVDQLLNIL